MTALPPGTPPPGIPASAASPTPGAPVAGPAAVPPLAIRALDLIRSEWTKLRSVRANYWTLLIVALVTLGLTAAVARAIATTPGAQPGALSPVTGSFLGYAEYTILPVSILGVLTFTSEYATGLIRTTLVGVPRRWALLAAKAAVTGGVALVAGELLTVACFLLTQAQLAGTRRGVPITAPGAAGAVLAAGFLLPVCVLAALGLGAIIRHTAGAIAATVGVVYLLGGLCLTLPAPWKLDLGRFTLPFAAYQLMTPHPQAGLFPPVISLLVVVAWPAAILAFAGLVISRRDA